MSSPEDKPAGFARVKRPVRDQYQFMDACLDQLIPDDHRVRAVWAYVQSLDLQPLYKKIQAIEGSPGRDAVAPEILLALWLYATIEGEGSARQLARLCERDIVYRWICGEVGVNHHLLSDFRVAHGEFLNHLLTDSIAALMHQQLVTLETVAQDGMRVRAHAGGDTFRRRGKLEDYRRQAAEQVEHLAKEVASDPAAGSARQKAAKKRAAEERLERVQEAVKNLKELQDQKEGRKKGTGDEARCSTTDPEARKMKMGDNGFRPAYNVQFVTDGATRMIVAVEVTNNGSDGGQMTPLHDDIRERYQKTPQQYIVDGGFPTVEDVTQLEQAGSQVFAPMNHGERITKRGGDAHARRARDTDEMFAMRQRMKTDEARTVFRQRPSIAEFPNAECRNRGLQQFTVRGLVKVKAMTLWYVLAFNLMRMWNLKFV